ncbi:MAG TPA: fatty acid desaturase [Rhizomicrobium sp.]|nr:fatty acid desaturase [Rhizomicrobium sp.]
MSSVARAGASLSPEKRLALLARRGIAVPLFIFSADLGLYGLCVFGAVASGDTWIRLSLSVLAGVFVSLLAIVGHDAGHRSFTSVRWLNDVIGTVAFLPSLHPFGRWKHHHNQIHHRYTAQLGIDNAYPPMTVDAYERAGTTARALYRFKRSLAGQATHYLLDIWLPKMFLPGRREQAQLRSRDWFELALVWAWPFVFVGLTGSLLHVAAGRDLGAAFIDAGLFGLLIPFAVWNLFISFVTIVQHTGPDAHWIAPTGRPSSSRQKIRGTVHILFPEVLDRFFHRVMQHPAHHIHSGVPLYLLKQAETELEAHGADAAIVSARWTPLYHWRLTRDCKLYDPHRDAWCNFALQTTTGTCAGSPASAGVHAEALPAS